MRRFRASKWELEGSIYFLFEISSLWKQNVLRGLLFYMRHWCVTLLASHVRILCAKLCEGPSAVTRTRCNWSSSCIRKQRGHTGEPGRGRRQLGVPTTRGDDDAVAYDAMEGFFFSLKTDKWPSYKLANEVNAEVFFKSLLWCNTMCLSQLWGEVEVREL